MLTGTAAREAPIGNRAARVGREDGAEGLAALLEPEGMQQRDPAGEVGLHRGLAGIREVHRAELLPLIEAALATRGSAEWAEEMSRVGIPAGVINAVDQALAHPQVLARDMVLTTEHPTAGTLRMTGSPIKLTRHTTTVRRPPPLLGQHTDEVLGELGYSDADIASLRAAGVVR